MQGKKKKRPSDPCCFVPTTPPAHHSNFLIPLLVVHHTLLTSFPTRIRPLCSSSLVFLVVYRILVSLFGNDKYTHTTSKKKESISCLFESYDRGARERNTRRCDRLRDRRVRYSLTRILFHLQSL